MANPHPEDCVCAYCRNRKPFTVSEHLLEAIASGNAAVFAGAGVSTENRTYARRTFYEEICSELKIPEGQPFPKVMDVYCSQPDGRLKLLSKIKKRFDYFISFDEFYLAMTQFHRSISSLYVLNDIITTNWDDFFERECNFDAFVYDSDLAFWDASRRRVMKIHGSITNFGSIVATSADYRRSFKRLNDGPLLVTAASEAKKKINLISVLLVASSFRSKAPTRLSKSSFSPTWNDSS